MSKTPRTDENTKLMGDHWNHEEGVPVDFARELEEELNEKTERAKAYFAALEIAEAEIKQARLLVAEARAEIERKDKLIERLREALEILADC